jgi:hypothetical protein
MANNDFMGDARLTKSDGAAVRGSRQNADADREQKNGTVLTSEERKRLLRQGWMHEILPTPPEVPGLHFCWLSTTNQSDSIYNRQRQGYVPVKASEVPGFGTSFRKEGGEFDGCVAVNEMILFKIPSELFNDLMTIYHHDMPAENEQAIYEKMVANTELDAHGRPVMTVEGDFDRLRQAPKAPSFVSR